LDKGSLAEHEWLEILLYNGIPRRNTNEIAHALIARFGTVLNVLSASVEELQQVKGVGVNLAGYLRCIGHFYEEYQESNEPKFYGKFSSEAFMPFVKQTYEGNLFEVIDIYLLDGEGRIVKKQRFSIDSICSVRVVPEEVAGFLLEENASGAVMVHNHPYGDAMPSDTDDMMTKNCQMLCSMHNRLLCDHIIYSPNGMFSYYLSGRMGEISKNYSVGKLLK
jgi:DNA repair protein RadC